jgi:hypothetical protein
MNGSSRDSSVGIETAYGQGQEIFSSPRRPDRLWGPFSLLVNRNSGTFPQE